jgi:hypothetical protein
MLITLLILVALFFVVRALMLRYGSNAVLSNAVGAAVVIAFLAGFFANFIVFADRQPTTAAAPAVAPAAAPAAPSGPDAIAAPTGTAVNPSIKALSPDQVNGLVSGGTDVAYGVIDSLGGSGPSGSVFPAGAPLHVNGWAGDPATKSTAAGLVVIIDGTHRFDASAGYGGKRMDVATAFHTMAMLNTNVFADVSTRGLAKGEHRIALATVGRDRRHYRIVTVPARSFTLN